MKKENDEIIFEGKKIKKGLILSYIIFLLIPIPSTVTGIFEGNETKKIIDIVMLIIFVSFILICIIIFFTIKNERSSIRVNSLEIVYKHIDIPKKVVTIKKSDISKINVPKYDDLIEIITLRNKKITLRLEGYDEKTKNDIKEFFKENEMNINKFK